MADKSLPFLLHDMKYLRMPNESHNEWIDKYNSLIDDIESGKLVFSEDYLEVKKEDYPDSQSYKTERVKRGSMGKHHIIPKKYDPSLEKVKENLLPVPFKEHCLLHYYLWKADPSFSLHLWFIYSFGRKHGIWELPGGDEERELLKEDLKEARRLQRENKALQEKTKLSS